MEKVKKLEIHTIDRELENRRKLSEKLKLYKDFVFENFSPEIDDDPEILKIKNMMTLLATEVHEKCATGYFHFKQVCDSLKLVKEEMEKVKQEQELERIMKKESGR